MVILHLSVNICHFVLALHNGPATCPADTLPLVDNGWTDKHLTSVQLFSPVVLVLPPQTLPYGSEDGGSNSYMFHCPLTWNVQDLCVCISLVFKVCRSPRQKSPGAELKITQNGVKT